MENLESQSQVGLRVKLEARRKLRCIRHVNPLVKKSRES